MLRKEAGGWTRLLAPVTATLTMDAYFIGEVFDDMFQGVGE